MNSNLWNLWGRSHLKCYILRKVLCLTFVVSAEAYSIEPQVRSTAPAGNSMCFLILNSLGLRLFESLVLEGGEYLVQQRLGEHSLQMDAVDFLF